MIKIVKATKKHIPDVVKINKVLDTPHYFNSDKKKIEKFVSKGECFVALIDGKIAGAMTLSINEDSYEIVTLAATERKGGVGSKLIKFAVNKCKKDKIPKLWCWSLIQYKAKGFYKKMGFEEDILLRKQWYGEDCYLFGKVIK